jgi:hypothetical protein
LKSTLVHTEPPYTPGDIRKRPLLRRSYRAVSPCADIDYLTGMKLLIDSLWQFVQGPILVEQDERVAITLPSPR